MWGYFLKTIASLDTKDIITLIIAVYGAVLSTLLLIQSVNKERRRIVVDTGPCFLAYPDGNVGTQQTEISVSNHGHRPVVVNAPTIRMPNKRFMNFMVRREVFPKRLEDGDAASLEIADQEIADALRRENYSGKVTLWSSCTDQTGRRYWGKKWRFDIDEYTR